MPARGRHEHANVLYRTDSSKAAGAYFAFAMERRLSMGTIFRHYAKALHEQCLPLEDDWAVDDAEAQTTPPTDDDADEVAEVP